MSVDEIIRTEIAKIAQLQQLGLNRYEAACAVDGRLAAAAAEPDAVRPRPSTS